MSRPKRLAATKAALKFRSAKDEDDEHDDIEVDVNERSDEMQAMYIPEDDDDDQDAFRPSKRRRAGRNSTQPAPVNNNHCFPPIEPEQQEASSIKPTATPQRRDPSHSATYHIPNLLAHPSARQALLSWFDSVSSDRSMPWRKPWINPADYDDLVGLRSALEKRAYEVWISEIMLQQTRVVTVIGYWTTWMARWPTIHDLAEAETDDLLSAWRGLGYYNRVIRIQTAAKLACCHPVWQGLLPADVGQLEKGLPGVGKYTAGAISAIVYGLAEPMVDGNVLRVLSRQLGIYGDVKTDKAVIDMIWRCASALVRQIARDGAEAPRGGEEEPEEVLPSDRPGRWGQALMELGSTVCMPKPHCLKCPITSTCRAYSEGYALAVEAEEVAAPENRDKVSRAPRAVDIEDICNICDEFQEDICDLLDDTNTDVKSNSKSKSPFFAAQPGKAPTTLTPKALAIIANHAAKYPLKKPKKKMGQQESIVCVIRRSSDGRYLVQRRPPKGLLANLWEFPSDTHPANLNIKTLSGNAVAMNAVAFNIIHDSELLFSPKRKGLSDWVRGGNRCAEYQHVGELGVVPWTFSHLKLTMYVQLFELSDDQPGTRIVWAMNGARQKWSTREEIDAESIGTGMMKCWDLVKEAEDKGR